ncbi:hypothetical protein [Methylobacter sp.]|uniref:hypothetical protein n=1 Tax=Methylobacter sp. TaxID=2051955 RepID=UPI002FE0F1C9
MHKNQTKDRAEAAKGKVGEVTGMMVSNKGHGDRRRCPKERRQDRRGFVIT